MGFQGGRPARPDSGDGPLSGAPADQPVAQREEQQPEALARSIVLRQLTSSPKSRRQLETKLAERRVPPEVAQAVLDRFEEVRLVDDAEFAQMWVRGRAETRSLARGALKRELAEKGITGEAAEDALAQRTDEDEAGTARNLVRRKLRGVDEFADRAARDRQVRRLVSMLGRKGYSPSVAFRAVQEVMDAQPER